MCPKGGAPNLWTDQFGFSSFWLFKLFGYSVSIFDDNAIVGCPLLRSGGFAYIFNRNWRTGIWSQSAKLSSSIEYNQNVDFFGGSVSLYDNIV